MIDVAFRVLPIDVVELEAPCVPFDRLLQALPEAEQVVDLLVRWQESIIYDVLQGLHSCKDVALAERVLATLESDDVLPTKLVSKDPLEHDVRQATATSRNSLVWRDVRVPKLLEQLQRRELGDEIFLKRGGIHMLAPNRAVGSVEEPHVDP